MLQLFSSGALRASLVLCLCWSLHGQGLSDGFRLFSPLPSTLTYLMDNAGNIVHTWPSSFTPGTSAYLLNDGSLLRAIKTGTLIGITGGEGGGVQRMDLNGNLLWDYRMNTGGVHSHHDIHPMPNGNVLMMAWEEKTNAEAIAAGRNPALLQAFFRLDFIVEVKPTGPTSGQVVWEWHVWDHLVQDFDPGQANHGIVGDHPELINVNFPPDATLSHDWNHFNGIDYDPVNDLIILSCHSNSEVWIIDHSTTTAEAAGHTGGDHGKGGDLLYRWGNPQAYDAGTPADQRLVLQHDPRFIPAGRPGAGHVTIFNNQFTSSGSEVVEIALPRDPFGNFIHSPGAAYGPVNPAWSFTSPGFYSPFVSSAERLPNGNTLVTSGVQGQILEVTPTGQILWMHQEPAGWLFHAHYVERTLWSNANAISTQAGGIMTLDAILGTAHAGDLYYMAASASGTAPGFDLSGHHLPLNIDAMTTATLTLANTPLLPGTMGTLDSLGRGTGSLAAPPGVLAGLAGYHLDFAMAAFDPMTGTPTWASNSIPLIFLP